MHRNTRFKSPSCTTSNGMWGSLQYLLECSISYVLLLLQKLANPPSLTIDCRIVWYTIKQSIYEFSVNDTFMVVPLSASLVDSH